MLPLVSYYMFGLTMEDNSSLYSEHFLLCLFSGFETLIDLVYELTFFYKFLHSLCNFIALEFFIALIIPTGI